MTWFPGKQWYHYANEQRQAAETARAMPRHATMPTQTKGVSEMATAKKPVEPKPQITLIEALTALIEKHGSQAQAAVETGINKTYFSRMVNGIKDWPSDETLAALGLRRNVSYEWVKQPRAKKVS